MTAKDILLAVIIPLLLAEVGPWCGWLAAKFLPLAARLRYGDTERAAVRLEEWSADLGEIPGQLTKLAYAIGQLAAGSAVSAGRKTRHTLQKAKELTGPADTSMGEPIGMPIGGLTGYTIIERNAVIHALRSLPRNEREAITLRYYADLSEAEIAAEMEISRQAVKLHTAAGMGRLRSALEAASGPTGSREL
jgi:DNA-directed RNA polymerase specialized sigma24 family protein